MRLAALALATFACAAPVAAQQPVVAVPELSFSDTSGEADDQTEAHAERLVVFAETLRKELGATGIVDVVTPTCDPAPCRPGATPFGRMAEAARAAGTPLLLVGGLHKMSSLIGNVKLTLIDVDADKVLCDRSLTYRGDTDQSWKRAAAFSAEDVAAACFR